MGAYVGGGGVYMWEGSGCICGRGWVYMWEGSGCICGRGVGAYVGGGGCICGRGVGAYVGCIMWEGEDGTCVGGRCGGVQPLKYMPSLQIAESHFNFWSSHDSEAAGNMPWPSLGLHVLLVSVHTLQDSVKPVVAAINGSCLGGGFEVSGGSSDHQLFSYLVTGFYIIDIELRDLWGLEPWAIAYIRWLN